ncbi:unnamed protein product [Lasius platythorax]|uniref:Uncharacterized protein n=1 Tax=Lasius platythorax TaxID=488582 RepID=A0AAV2NSQ1_9HYME
MILKTLLLLGRELNVPMQCYPLSRDTLVWFAHPLSGPYPREAIYSTVCPTCFPNVRIADMTEDDHEPATAVDISQVQSSPLSLPFEQFRT